ncbi:hypothetical protein CesoFtcFv8_014303 [Champsocephalus esox]|uniref:Uncharacterized protein n=2 Tax=Champsocephalus TaxID=52236 RepID=A0AAN8DGD3_CHAGU|nr:hypothetical protein CesoFtcFv8_014303 [Champsocephalus esox]KAK5921365.1 hypothetical protein CgunFtcFv8_025076 [Champsocephalus gunnari]
MSKCCLSVSVAAETTMMGPGCRPHHVDVVLLRTAWLQDSWLSHWTLKRTHPHFLSLSPEAELGSALSAVIT